MDRFLSWIDIVLDPVPLLFLLGTVYVIRGKGLRPLELGPSTHTLRERAIRGLYNDVRVEWQRGDGARGTTLLRETFPKLYQVQRVNFYFLHIFSPILRILRPKTQNLKLHVILTDGPLTKCARRCVKVNRA